MMDGKNAIVYMPRHCGTPDEPDYMPNKWIQWAGSATDPANDRPVRYPPP